MVVAQQHWWRLRADTTSSRRWACLVSVLVILSRSGNQCFGADVNRLIPKSQQLHGLGGCRPARHATQLQVRPTDDEESSEKEARSSSEPTFSDWWEDFCFGDYWNEPIAVPVTPVTVGGFVAVLFSLLALAVRYFEAVGPTYD
mmetsp:Transcript_21409/g.47877  ORF Transcript_21409/g.47877 Transcript_21409/m.47877 type:complete len:144 (+) Transcript_21409:247-678(+)